jgi:retinol-binding protein 3
MLFISLIAFFGIYVIGNIVIVAQPGKSMTIDAATQNEAIKNLFENMNESYVFADVARKMEADILKRQKNGEYAKITDGSEFAAKLTEDLQAISKDKHLRVRFSPEVLPVKTENNQPSAEEEARYKENLKRINYGFDSVKRLDGNIGYIEFRGFVDPESGKETVAAAMNFVHNTDALIFDLRRNGGGSPAMVALICSYLFGDEKVHLNDLYWRAGDKTEEFWTTPQVLGKKYLGKDVYVLTSNRTFSGAEEFSYNLKNLKRATIVGETTGGGAHPGGTFRLSDHFSAFISTGRAISPITKTNWEGTGVKPDVEVAKEIAFETAYIAVLKKSLANQTDERQKEALKNLIRETEETIIKKQTATAKQ